MAEPTGSSMPTNYDSVTTLLGSLIDQRVLTLASTIDASTTTISVNETITDVEVPCYILFTLAETANIKEIIFAQGKSGKSFTSCLRGVRGSTAQAHTASEPMSLIVSGKLFNQFRDAVIAGEKYQGLVGTEAGLPSPTVVGQVAFTSDTKKVLVCLAVGSWTLVGNLVSHANLGGRSDDDHTIYHNDTRATTWHNGLSGGHVTDGDTHTHLIAGDATGAGRVTAGLASARPGTPTYQGQIYYETDTKYLYIAKGTGGSDWVRIVGAPTGTIVAFLEADITTYYGGSCPSGWTRFTDMDGRLPKGAPAGVTSPLNTGGSSTHLHSYSGVPAHVHNVSSFNATLGTTSNHTHSIPLYGGVSGSSLHVASNLSVTAISVDSSGSHTHLVTTTARDTSLTKKTADNSEGTTSGDVGSQTSFPAYQEVIWCQKS